MNNGPRDQTSTMPDKEADDPAELHTAVPRSATSTEGSSFTKKALQAQQEERPAKYRDVFAVREYRYLFQAYLLSLLGDQLAKVALTILVYDTSRSAGWAALTFAISYMPWVVGGPLLSTLADRLPRRRVLIACDLGRMALWGLLAIPGIPIPAVIAVVFIASLFGPPFFSARAAMMPDIFTDDRYTVANGVDNMTHQVSQVLGFAIGGAIVAIVSARGALIVDAGTFLLSALLIRAGVKYRAVHVDSESRSERRSLWSAAGYVFRDHRLRAYLLLFWHVSAFTYAIEGLTAPLARELGSSASASVGFLLAAPPLGLTVGVYALNRCRPSLRLRLLLPLAILSCAALIPAWFSPRLAVVLVLFFVAGVGTSFSIPLNPIFVRAVPTAIRARAFGIAVSGVNAAQGLATILAGVVVANLGWSPTSVITFSGAIGLVGTLALSRSWPHRAGEQAVPSAAGA